MVLDYNNTMGGVDKADQEQTYYPVMRKQQKRYYKKIFHHLLEQCLWNAFVLFMKCRDQRSKVEHADFIWMLVDRIFTQFMSPIDQERTPGRRRSSIQGNPKRLTGHHFVDYVPPTDHKRECAARGRNRMAKKFAKKRDFNVRIATLDSVPSRASRITTPSQIIELSMTIF